MIRGIITGVVIAFLGMAALFAINFAATQISPEHYRRIVVQALESGTLTTVIHLPFAPSKDMYVYGGNDCLILGALVMPRDSDVKASVSPRMPLSGSSTNIDRVTRYPPDGLCLMLAATMHALARDPASDRFSEISYYHRYIHGDMTVAALLLAIMSFMTATTVLLDACYAMLATIAMVALFRLRAGSPTERRRAASFLIIVATLACFYALSVFDRSFSFAPTDLVIFALILYALVQPLAIIPPKRFIVTAAIFGTLIAVLEFLTGGVPLGLATLVALIALGGAPDWRTLRNRVLAGTATFTAAVIASFVYKLLAVWAVFGTNEVSVFVANLWQVTGKSVEAVLSDSAKAALVAYYINPHWLDANILTRVAFAGLMLIYSSFFLAWGSHLVGAAIVLVPTPVLLAIGASSFQARYISRQAREHVGLAAAGAVPILWYIVFSAHTIVHSSYMVRPLALNLALCVVAALPPCRSPLFSRVSGRPADVRAT